MQIVEIGEKKIWENFFWQIEEKTFLNCWEWGEFCKLMGEKIWRLGIKEKENLICAFLVTKICAKRGSFLYLPHCPSILKEKENQKEKILKLILDFLKKLAKKEKCAFLRVLPLWERTFENQTLFKKLGFKRAPFYINPEMTFLLDLQKTDQELLAKMRKTTRYLIRQAQKQKEIEIFEKNDLEGLKIFYQIYCLTAKRHSFVPYSFEYLKNEFLVFSKENQISILLGKYKDEVVCGGIFIFWQKICFYHHGASSQKYPKIPVSYLLIWEAIKKAKEKGCQKFNFWGGVKIEEKNKKHPWYGLSFFKAGFGAKEKEYLFTQDFVLSPLYWLNFLVETLRKIKRGYF